MVLITLSRGLSSEADVVALDANQALSAERFRIIAIARPPKSVSRPRLLAND
jgi:hypothetical protein